MSIKNRHYKAEEMAQKVKISAAKARRPEFDPWNPYTKLNVILSSMPGTHIKSQMLWCAYIIPALLP